MNSRRLLAPVALAALPALAATSPGASAESASSPGEKRQGSFAWSEEKDPGTGWTLWTLRCDDDKDTTRSQVVRICPDGGANLFSYVYGGVELLHQPKEIKALRNGGAGNPILYPTPNRVRDGRFAFEGREFKFSDTGKTTLHGLVNRLGWQSEPPAFVSGPDPGDTGVEVKAWIDFEPGQAHYDRFPIHHRLTVVYRLVNDGVRIGFRIDNRDTQRLPFGFALHPYFRILGARENTHLRVPARMRMEATPDLLPTGRLRPIGRELWGADSTEATPWMDRPLSDLALDDVFWGMTPDAPPGYRSEDAGIRVDLPASEHFTHMVIYTPKGQPFFCMENQTCSTDAHNLHAKGLIRESHLLVVDPGQSMTGRVQFRPSRLSAPKPAQ